MNIGARLGAIGGERDRVNYFFSTTRHHVMDYPVPCKKAESNKNRERITNLDLRIKLKQGASRKES